MGTSSPASAGLTADGRPPLNQELLLERCLGNAHLMRQLLRKFTSRVHTILPRMEQRLAAGEWSEVVTLAHTLQGMAANLSLENFRRSAAELEQAARRSDRLLGQRHLQLLEHEAQRCLAYILTLLARHGD